MAKTIQILINGKKVCLNHDRPVRNTYDGVTYQMGMLGDVVTYIQRHRGELKQSLREVFYNKDWQKFELDDNDIRSGEMRVQVSFVCGFQNKNIEEFKEELKQYIYDFGTVFELEGVVDVDDVAIFVDNSENLIGG